MTVGRAPFHGRRRRRSRLPAWLTNRWRWIGGALMVGAVLVGGWLVTSDDFTLDASGIDVSGIGYTDLALVEAAIAIDPDEMPNVFMIPTQQIERELAALSQVAAVEVSAVLPNRLIIDIDERTAVAILRTPDADYRIDSDGVVLDRRTGTAAGPDELPVLDDRRTDSGPALQVGERISEMDVAAILQLLAVTPATVGSTADSLVLSADDEDGYAVTAEPNGWRAIFGHYTPNLRPPETISRQVECLRSLLADREPEIATIYLAPLDDRCGTYLPRSTPAPTPSPSARM